MMPYGTAAEAEAALGRSMTWAEALWFRYSAAMPDLWLTWHVALVYLVMYALAPLPVMILQQLAPGYALRHKLQPGVPQPSPVSAYLTYIWDSKGVTLSALGPFPLIYSAAFKLFGVRTGLPLPSVWETAMHLMVYSLVDDYLSYWLHRFLHTKWGYKKIHCIHHEKTAPTGFAAAYAAGTELSLYLVALFVGPAIVPSHITTHWLLYAIRIMEAFDTHCGYHFPFSLTRVIPFYGGAEFHDYHHYAGGKTHSNFGSLFTYCDYIYGTNKGYMHHKGNLAKLKMEAEHNMKGNNGKEE
ncbi:very-long-chain aldehyde decarbonylase GL1-10-like [Miscanthus floridulus]|uniref:very-long-chain aldehyde decarbonylase GL1-10-like n=1 Tax=Miscanthus floridulus TaxID=154761 RepID=UPI00345AE6D4